MQAHPLALFPARTAADTPSATAEQMREIDRLAIRDAKLSLEQMLENAGRALALVARDFLLAAVTPLSEGTKGAAVPAPTTSGSILVVAGKGANGGGALAAARHLRNWGYAVDVVLSTQPAGLGRAATQQHQILHKDSVRAIWPAAQGFDDAFPAAARAATVVIDGLIGYGLSGPLQGDVAVLVEAILDRAPPAVISLDVPTGFDATTGAVHSSGIVATGTVTLALPKSGLLQGDAVEAIGELLLADIGIPHYLYDRVGIDVPPDLFAEGPIVRLLTVG